MSFFIRILLVFISLVFSSSLFSQKDSSEWLFIYYMPYDNNLSYLAEDIHSMINNGIKSDNVNAVIQADYTDSIGMTRTSISETGKTTISIEEENSASKKSFDNYLNWVHNNFEFEKSAVIILDHGGKLDEVGLDEYPDTSFLKVTDIRKSLKKFNKKTKDTVDLVFYQVCAKSSIEPLYELADVTKYTMASQVLLGAPNRYYTELFKNIGTKKNLDGKDVASLIANNEAIDMYSMYTCIDNSKLGRFRNYFVEYIKAIDKRVNFGFEAYPIYFDYASERYWDLESFLLSINSTRPSEIALRTKLVDYMNDELIVFLKKNQYNAEPLDFCGISISALSKSKIRTYRKLKFYRQFRIGKLDLR